MCAIDLDGPSFIDEGQGLPLVFVHGFPLSREAWARQVEALSASFRTIAPNLRGFGGHGDVQGKLTMDRLAEDIGSLVETLGCGPVILVGHSMGGYVALAFARRYPQWLRGLVLVGTRAGSDSPEASAGRLAAAEGVREKGIGGIVDAMTQKMLAPGRNDPQSLAEVRSFMSSASREGVIGALLGMAERPDASADLRKISRPTLVVTGAEDRVIDPAESEILAEAIPGARLRIIPGAGHLVAWEEPEAFNRELADWITDIE